MSYKVTFYGDRKPETLANKNGEELYQDFQKGELPENVEVRAGLTVGKRTIREVEYIPDQEELYSYSSRELEGFERDKLSSYLDERGRLTFYNELRFLESESLIRFSVRSEPICTYSDVELYVVAHMTREYGRMTEKLSQWKTWKARRAYAIKKHEEELEQTALQTI